MKIITLVSAIVAVVKVCYGQLFDSFIYTPIPITYIQQSQICKNGGSITNLIALNSTANTLIGWGQQCGVAMISINSTSVVSYNLLPPSAANTITIFQQQQAQLVWMIQSTKVLIFNIIGLNNLQQVQTTSYTASGGSFVDSVQIPNLYAVLLIFQRQIQFIDTYNQVVCTTTYQLKPTDSDILSALAINDKYLLLGQGTGITVLEFLQLSPQSNAVTIKNDGVVFTQYNAQVTRMVPIGNFTFAIQTQTSGIYFGNFSQFLITRNTTNFTFSYFSQDRKYLEMKYLQVNQNQTYILSEDSYNAIKLVQLDFTQAFAQRIYHLIPISSKTSDLKLSNDNQFIISVTQSQINFYQQVPSNYQTKNPSILSINDNIVANSFTQSSKVAQRCITDSTFLYYSKSSDGVIILRKDPINKTLLLESILKIDSGSHVFSMPIVNTTNLIVGDTSLYFVNMTNTKAPTVFLNSTFGQTSLSSNYAVVSTNQQTLFIAAGLPGLLIVNIANIAKPALISQIQATPQLQYNCQNLQTFMNEKYIIAAYRYYGIVVYNILTLTAPTVVSMYPLSGTEDFRISSSGLFMVVSGRDNGITILDISNLQSITQISNIFVQGSTHRAQLIQNDTFILTTSILNGQLQLIDITNITNPILVQQYQYNQGSSAYDICLFNKQNQGYLVMGDGIVLFNLYTYKNYNTNFFDISNPTQFVNIPLTTQFLIGQVIGIKISEVFPSITKKSLITNIYYYNQFYQMQSLPSWATFISGQQMLSISMQKEMLLSQIGNSIETKQFVFEIKEQLLNNDFIYTGISISSTTSLSIFLLCQQNQIIDTQSYVVKYNQQYISYIFQAYTAAQINHILYVLHQKVITFPVQIQVKNSLNYDVRHNVIYSQSNVITIQLSTDAKTGVFIESSYLGVTVNYSELLDSITISGGLSNINQALKDQIRFANYTGVDNIQITMTINDNLNYVLSSTLNLSTCQFIKLNKKIFNNPKKTIQSDFNSKNDGSSSVSILSTFQYTFDQQVFLDEDDQVSLSYSAYILQDDQYILIPSEYWISFSKQERTFYGSTYPSQFRDVVYLLVNATDGYTYSFQTFQINIDILPPYYAFTIMMEVLLPFAFLWFCYFYKSIVVNVFRKSSLKQTPYQIELDRQYYIHVPILDNCIEDGLKIWRQYKCTIIKEIVLRELTFLKMKKKPTPTDTIRNEAQEGNSPNISNSEIRQNIEMHEKQNNTLTQSVIKPTPTSAKNAMKGMMNFSQKIVKNIGDGQVKQIKKHLIEQKVNYGVNQFIYLQGSGALNYMSILDSMHTWCKLHYNKPKVLNDLKNPGSLFAHVMIGLVSRYFAQLDKTVETVIQLLKQSAIKSGLMEKEWYKAYVDCISDEEIVLVSPVPKCYYNQAKIEEQLVLLQQINPEIQESEFNLPLIKENLKAIALGFTSDRKSFFPMSRHQCIDCYSHEIHCIKAYRPFLKNSFFNKKKQVEVEKEKELSLNSLLPSWINSVDIINGSLFFSINAQIKDQGKYQIKILSTQSIVIKVLYINIGSETTPGDSNEESKGKNSDHLISKEQRSYIQSDSQSKCQEHLKQEDIQFNLQAIHQQEVYSQIDSPQPFHPLRKAFSQFKNNDTTNMYHQSSHKFSTSKLMKLESKSSWRDNRDEMSDLAFSQRQVEADLGNIENYQSSPKLSPFYQFDQKTKQLFNHSPQDSPDNQNS